MLNNFTVSQKLLSGFGLLVLLLLISNSTGYIGLVNLTDDINIIGNEEAPITDAANEMKISLLTARNAMEEYKSATTVVISNTQNIATDGLLAIFDETVVDFDKFGEVILKGGNLGEVKVTATDNPKLAAAVEASNAIHDDQFQPAARAMIVASKKLVSTNQKKQLAKQQLDDAYLAVLSQADKAEDLISESSQLKKNATLFSAYIDKPIVTQCIYGDLYFVDIIFTRWPRRPFQII